MPSNHNTTVLFGKIEVRGKLDCGDRNVFTNANFVAFVLPLL